VTDFAVPNSTPGKCAKCSGSGVYRWAGAMVNGVWRGQEGPCHSCRGTGRQDEADMRRNEAFNRHQLSRITLD
jgi:DnaJ-class molecular chaperone